VLNAEWTVGAEQQRDRLHLEMTPPRLERFSTALKKILKQIEMFEESALISPSPQRVEKRSDKRYLVMDSV